MPDQSLPVYLEPTQESGRELFSRKISGGIVMVNLLRFRETADYSAFPQLAPTSPISGGAAYEKYMRHTLPFLKASGGEILFYGKGGGYFIGPPGEFWDIVMLVRQSSLKAFLKFASDPAYLAGLGHRIAALQDSRLLPVEEMPGLPM